MNIFSDENVSLLGTRNSKLSKFMIRDKKPKFCKELIR